MTPEMEREAREIVCPFCGEEGFDLVGLKGHIQGGVFFGPCEAYEAIDRKAAHRAALRARNLAAELSGHE